MFEKTVHIFDLDGTVIDSRHRYRTLPNGDIDLQHWLNMSQDESLVFQDKLLPRANTMRRVFNTGHHTIVCTSRLIDSIWTRFLEVHGLYADAILARPKGCMIGDADLKEHMIDEYLEGHNTCLEDIRAVMYEDHLGVIDRMRSRGVVCSIEGYGVYK